MTAVKTARQRQPLISWLDRIQQRIAHVYDTLYSTRNREKIERFIIYLAVIGFLVHLFGIFLGRNVPALAPMGDVFGTFYLSAIYTPFSFILFYEVLILVLSIPESTTLALATQFEIISLIILRNVFKDLARFENLEQIAQQTDIFVNILWKMGGGLLLFLMVTIFHHISHHRTHQEQEMGLPSPGLQRFVERKKIIALIISILLVAMEIVSIATWGFSSYLVVFAGVAPETISIDKFYVNLFTILIFTDVLILMLSLLQCNHYHLVIRNAGFVIATILLRISLAAARPYDIILALVAAVFAILMLVIYKYSAQIKASHTAPWIDH